MSDQKYRQKGYRDNGSSDRPPRQSAPKGPRDPRDKPRGRGLGAPTATVFRCANCGTKIEVEGVVAVDASCRSCKSDLHSCTQCRHFDPGARFECRQPVEASVRSKAKNNECTYFEPKQAQEFEQEKGGTKDAKSAFDALFDF